MKHGHRHLTTLRQRLFRYFAVALVVSAAIGFGLGHVFNRLTRHDHHDHPIQAFVAARLVDSWDNPVLRDRVLREVGEQLMTGAELRDASGTLLGRYGGTCAEPFVRSPLVARDGHKLGELTACPPRAMGPGGARHEHGPPRPLPRLLALLAITLLAIWAASGRVARWLAGPLQDLARVADDLGHGKLSSRAALTTGPHGVDELDRLAHAINDMAERIERQLHDQRELLAAVSHELRTPLGHAKLLIEMARDQPDDQKPLDELEAELAELERMVGQLLASARLDFTALQVQDMDAIQLAVRVLDRTGVDAAALRVDAEQTLVRGDPALLSQALANLIDNARRHGGKLVELRLRTDGDRLAFDALDDGPGFGAGEAEKAFEPFQRGPASHGGLGLGLTLVRRIALAHQGSVTAGNRPQGGACVTLTVPLVQPAES